mmetsp:Transcript_20448/g.52027  ORF Transcript_20448/g.52027 Transcript_20448/m.52027 type:complete len:84 (+) Transcript_20448:794-1045(+)|eukprot:CAMPEP_0115835626 /NCGR_PEP_ID=MMETSP0287-20121206/4291_1 /TAXON_ID=412157 /ORGANISM="Chrysochromulina rotalis, Strain UIO044" /LENGTH=83 /DNA_ID=CAMNT_0003289089 /DNA_START=791 /DNA_END=1042 /DNA_ORIENTATION=-
MSLGTGEAPLPQFKPPPSSTWTRPAWAVWATRSWAVGRLTFPEGGDGGGEWAVESETSCEVVASTSVLIENRPMVAEWCFCSE